MLNSRELLLCALRGLERIALTYRARRASITSVGDNRGECNPLRPLVIPYPLCRITSHLPHVDCSMALSVCGLSGPALRSYDGARHPAGRRVMAQADQRQGGTTAAGESNQTPRSRSDPVTIRSSAGTPGSWPRCGRCAPRDQLRLTCTVPGWDRLAAGRGTDPQAGTRWLLTGLRQPYQSLGLRVRLARLAGTPNRAGAGARRLGPVVACTRGLSAGQESLPRWTVLGRPGAGRFPLRGPAPPTSRPRFRCANFGPWMGVRLLSDEPGYRGGDLASWSWRWTRRGTQARPWRCSGRCSTGIPALVLEPGGHTITRRTSGRGVAAGPRAAMSLASDALPDHRPRPPACSATSPRPPRSGPPRTAPRGRGRRGMPAPDDPSDSPGVTVVRVRPVGGGGLGRSSTS